MDIYTHIKDAFYSGGHAFTGDKQIIQDIAFLVREGYLKLQLFPIASRQEYLTVVRNVGKNMRSDEASGGSIEHVALKLLSGEYLQKKYDLEVLYEHPLCGHYPDVMTTDNRIIVECGHTNNPEKILTYFKQSGVKECILVPYPDPDKQTVQAYSLIALDELKSFLDFWESEKHAEILKSLRR